MCFPNSDVGGGGDTTAEMKLLESSALSEKGSTKYLQNVTLRIERVKYFCTCCLPDKETDSWEW